MKSKQINIFTIIILILFSLIFNIKESHAIVNKIKKESFKYVNVKVILPNGKITYMRTKENIIHQYKKIKPKLLSYKKLLIAEENSNDPNKKTVIKDIKVAINFKNIHDIYPFIPIGKIKNFPKIIKIVFGISGNNLGNFTETIGNIHFILAYAKKYHIKTNIAVVIWGAAVGRIYNSKKIKTNYYMGLKMYKYSKLGVKFYACYNAMLINHLIKANIFKFVTPVPMGVLKIYELVHHGYTYITNP